MITGCKFCLQNQWLLAFRTRTKGKIAKKIQREKKCRGPSSCSINWSHRRANFSDPVDTGQLNWSWQLGWHGLSEVPKFHHWLKTLANPFPHIKTSQLCFQPSIFLYTASVGTVVLHRNNKRGSNCRWLKNRGLVGTCCIQSLKFRADLQVTAFGLVEAVGKKIGPNLSVLQM